MSDRRRRRARRSRDDHGVHHEPPLDRELRAVADDAFLPPESADAADSAETPADGLAEFERRRDELLRARREPRAARTSENRGDGDDAARGNRGGTPNPRPNPSPRPTPASVMSGGGATGTAAATTAAAADGGPDYSLLTPRRRVRRDGPMAWAGRRYRRFRRSLRENITAYGHRYNSVGGGTSADGRPLLLWLVDLPRLFAMHFDHAAYRSTRATTLLFRDLRSRPPRIEWDKTSVFSPLVGFTVPTAADLNPVWEWPAVRTFWANFREDWRAALAETFGGLAAIWANFRAELSAEFAALAGRFAGVLGWAQANLTRFDRLFRGSDDGAWVFACGTGVAGLTLTALLFWNVDDAVAATASKRGVADPATLAGSGVSDWREGEAPPTDDFDPDSDPFDGDPVADFSDDSADDGMLYPEPDVDRRRDDAVPVAAARSDLLPDPFGDAGWGDEPAYGGLAELGVAFARRELPADIPGYVPPDDDREAVVAARSGRRPLPEDPGGWAVGSFLVRAPAPPKPLPAMRGTGPARGVSLEPLRPSSGDDGASPAAAGLGLSVTRTPAQAEPDGVLIYDLRVSNDGDGPAAAAVEEVVGAGATVIEAFPEAAFTADPAGGGTLRWDLSDLPAGANRQLTVALAPVAGAGEVVTAARVVGAVRVAAGTRVEDPAPADPPAFDFPEEPPEPAAPPLDDFGTGFPNDSDFLGDAESGADAFDAPADDDPLLSPFGDEPEEEVEPAEPTAFDPPPFFEDERDDPPAAPAPLPDFQVTPAQELRPRPEPPVREDMTRDIADGPRLRVTFAGPPRAVAGRDVRLLVTVSNEGDAAAEAVTVTCPIPPGLRHPRGSLVRCVLGDLQPGATRTATLIARVTAAGGDLAPVAEVTARGGLIASVAAPMTVGGSASAGASEAPVAPAPLPRRVSMLDCP